MAQIRVTIQVELTEDEQEGKESKRPVWRVENEYIAARNGDNPHFYRDMSHMGLAKAASDMAKKISEDRLLDKDI